MVLACTKTNTSTVNVLNDISEDTYTISELCIVTTVYLR